MMYEKTLGIGALEKQQPRVEHDLTLEPIHIATIFAFNHDSVAITEVCK